MKHPKRSQYKYTKKPYRVRNWRSYEAGLRSRGDLTVWISEDAIKCWRAPASGKPGGQRIYAKVAIETALTLRMVFHLPLRQTEGFAASLIRLMGLAHAAPTRQQPQRGQDLCHQSRGLGVVDATVLSLLVGAV